MGHASFLYSGLLGALLGIAADTAHADDAGRTTVASYRTAPKAAGSVAPDLVALRKLFHTRAFNVVEPLGEFSGRDWNGLTPLGNTVTHEMREANERVAAERRSGTDQGKREGEARFSKN